MAQPDLPSMRLRVTVGCTSLDYRLRASVMALCCLFLILLSPVVADDWDDCLNQCVIGPLIGNYDSCARFDFDCVCSNEGFQQGVTTCTSSICYASSDPIDDFTSSLCAQAQVATGAVTATVTATLVSTVVHTATVINTASVVATVTPPPATVTVAGANSDNCLASTFTASVTKTVSITADAEDPSTVTFTYTLSADLLTTTYTLKGSGQEDPSTLTRTETATRTMTISATGAASDSVSSNNSVPVCADPGISKGVATGIGLGSALGGAALLAAVGALCLMRRKRDDVDHGDTLYISGKAEDHDNPQDRPPGAAAFANNDRATAAQGRPPQQYAYAMPSTIPAPAAFEPRRQDSFASQADAARIQRRRQRLEEMRQLEEQEDLLRERTGYGGAGAELGSGARGMSPAPSYPGDPGLPNRFYGGR